MIVRKYYIKEIVEFNVIYMKAGCDPVFVRDTFGFFYCVNTTGLYRCRSPPPINFELKNLKLIGGKKDGRTPKKKKM